MAIQPLGERVLIKQKDAEEKTASGIVLTTQSQEKPQIAEVIAVGTSDEINVKVGDKVIFPKYAGTEIKYEGEDFIIIEDEKLLAVVK